MMVSKGKEYVPDPNKFDLVTHHWSRTGQLIRKNLYTLYVVEGNKFFERPIKSGNLWYENNQPAGRIEFPNGVRKITEGAPHVAFTAKLEGDDALFYELEQEKNRNAKLEAELAAIRKDAAPKNAEQSGSVAPTEPLALTMKADSQPSLGKKG